MASIDRVINHQDGLDIVTELNRIAGNTPRIDTLDTAVSVLSTRMDDFTNLAEGSTTGDAELIDGRIGANGTTYNNIGGAIRGQVSQLKSAIIADYSASSTYKIGDYAMRFGVLVRCISEISTPEAYNGRHWLQVAGMKDVFDIYQKLMALQHNSITFESGIWNDNVIKSYANTRIRSANYIPIDSFNKIVFPSPFAAYAILLDENKTKLGFYGFNGGQGVTSMYRVDLLAAQPTAMYFVLDVFKIGETSADISSYVNYMNNDTVCVTWDRKRIENAFLCCEGTKIEAGTDLRSITRAGTYYCPNATIAETLTNCPTQNAFHMIVELSTGNDPDYFVQRIIDIFGTEYKQVCRNGSWSRNYRGFLPQLSYKKKQIIQNLVLKYIENRKYFYYEYNSIRNKYADGSCYTPKSRVVQDFPEVADIDLDGFFITNCSLYVQLLMMGRDPSDFIGKDYETYSPNITKYVDPTYGEYDFGYYFDFIDRAKCYGVGVRDEHDNLTRLYGYSGVGEEATSYNTRYSTGNSTGLYVNGQPINQSWLLFETASDMALELYRKGCEIQLSDLQIGDLVFTRPVYINDSFDATSYRGIGHVVMVYAFDADGLPKFTESAWMYPTLVRRGYDFDEDVDVLYTQKILRYAVMCARNPAAFGLGGNVPNAITVL